MSINILDEMIINRISAGEVVESPFSIVKELIDNSLDAGADKIIVEIKNGGIDYISVKDNGCGIELDDMPKVFLPHATSKIKNITDLESINTLGFRGEALASIANVSNVKLTTKTYTSDCAYTMQVCGGKYSDIVPTSIDCGTKIEMSDLFFNTPARRKFLKKPKQEENQITNIISRFILAHPDIIIKYIVDGKTILQSQGSGLQNAIYCIYGEEVTQNIMPIEKSIGGIKLSGYVSKVGYSKPNTTYQTLMVNGRYVIDEIVSKAVYMAFEEYLMPRQFPFYVLNLTLANENVDVNVHPSKMTVKFAYPSKIYDLTYSAVRSAIYEFLNPVSVAVNQQTEATDISVEKDLIKTDLSSLKEIDIPSVEYTPVDINKVNLRQSAYSPVTIFELNTQTKPENKQINQEVENSQDNYLDVRDVTDIKTVGVLFDEFIVLEKGENLILLDFHAGHERLNYDKFTKMVQERDIAIQDLIVPYVQELTEAEVDFILSIKDRLSELGFDIDKFGDKKIIINAIPVLLKDINLKNFVDDMIHDMKNLRPNLNNEINHYLMQKACKSSVRSGMKLSDMEIRELLKNLDINNPVLLCPHGRPIITVLPRTQIEKWFKRIV